MNLIKYVFPLQITTFIVVHFFKGRDNIAMGVILLY